MLYVWMVVWMATMPCMGSAMTARTVTEEGAWCWFADPRALHYQNEDGSINMTYMGYIDVHGNIKAMQYDFNRGRQDEVLVRTYFQPDDHNNPTFLVLPDGRVMVFYSRHTDEPCFYYRVSQRPGDITWLGEEKVIKTENNTTYPSPFILSDDPTHFYLCWRGIGWHPTIARITLPDQNDEVSIDWGPYQMVQSTGARPYAKYASNGKDKIYFAYTTGHPDNESPNFLYFNYVDINSKQLKDIQGNTLATINGKPFKVNKSEQFRKDYPWAVVDHPQERDWVFQVAPDKQGRPVIAMVRISTDKKSHDYYYVRWDGRQWLKSFVAHAGGHFHQSPDIEHCYSAGMAIDPDNVNTLYCSLPVEGKGGKVYELFRYVMGEDGKVASKEQLTFNSEKNNSRPFVIPGSQSSPLRLGWMNGDYYDWIVSKVRPKGYPTSICCDFKGFASTPDKEGTVKVTIRPDADNYGGCLLDLGDVSYWLDKETMKPEWHYNNKVYRSTNRLATADSWRNANRSTGGEWHEPVKLKAFELKVTREGNVLTSYINGLIDQRIDLGGCEAASANVFSVMNPDYEKSPFTGMTRRHWVEAGQYLLEGAFGYIRSLDDPMYFPKQLDKTYPAGESNVKVAKLEGLARTLFVAAPLLKENPELSFHGIRVADYYRHQLMAISNPQSKHYIAHRTGGPSQTLLELGSLAISMKAAQSVLWDPLPKEEKDKLAATMLSYGEGPTIGSNWMFFNCYILSFLKDQGYKVNEKKMVDWLQKLLDRYRGEGWYNDAPAYDYYSMWAYQSYGPLWVELFGKTMKPAPGTGLDEDIYQRISEKFLANEHDLVDNYPYMFARDGRMNMWGRSICYRFAAVTPLPLVEFAGFDKVNYGWLRRIASASLLQFMTNPDFLENGVPTMGFYGPFAPAVQIYSCRGSVYWIGKAFLGLLLPEHSEYWSAVENEGPWEKDMKKGKVYNRLQKATGLLITDYPDCGGSEMRSWCHESVASDWQKFRSSENYNKLAYHTEFPWMADGKNGEISMNYGTKNKKGEWEVLRLYDFLDFNNEVYRRKAVLETDTTVKYRLADICLPNGVLRVDRVSVEDSTDIRLGHYTLPLKNGGKGNVSTVEGVTVYDNGDYQLAMVPVYGWTTRTEVVYPDGLHPVSKTCLLPMLKEKVAGDRILVTLQLWKKCSEGPFTPAELHPVKSVKVSKDRQSVTVKLTNKETKVVNFQ